MILERGIAFRHTDEPTSSASSRSSERVADYARPRARAAYRHLFDQRAHASRPISGLTRKSAH